MTHTEPTELTTTISQARARIADLEYVPVSECVDWLLDCHNATEQPNVRNVVTTLLPQFSTGSLRKADAITTALDQIELALAVDAAFHDVEIDLED